MDDHYPTTTSHHDDNPQQQPQQLLPLLQLHRSLQRGSAHSSSTQQRGRTILTLLYLCVLGMCFLTPVLYYCRLHYEERDARRRLRILEAQGLEMALQNSNNNNNGGDGNNANGNNNTSEESRAARRKYLEERQARITQLVAPVRMVLTAANFPGGQDTSMEEQQEEEEATLSNNKKDPEEENKQQQQQQQQQQRQHPRVIPAAIVYDDNNDDDEDDVVIELPAPGLHTVHFGGGTSSSLDSNNNDNSSSTTTTPAPLRQASGLCPICLCAFQVGSDICWSSNELCEHVFHAECIINWLLRQPEGTLCPCCRRDFIVDPFDVLSVERGEQEQQQALPTTTDVESGGGSDNNNTQTPTINTTTISATQEETRTGVQEQHDQDESV